MAQLAAGTDNILLVTDSYKVSHHYQYPPNTTVVSSYFESRGGKFPSTVFFGLQYILKRWLVGQVVTKEKIEEAKALYSAHFGQEIFNEEGWNYILENHNGYLPLKIKAVPEGTVVPTHNVLFTVENTDPKCFWLTNYVETILVQCWYPITVATSSRAQKEIIAKYLSETADNLAGLPDKLHDYGFRGSTSVESAGIGGAAHLVNFTGSDTLASLTTAKRYYGCPIAGFSTPASEHSTVTTWGKQGEKESYLNLLTKFPTGLVVCVSDSYNIWNAVDNIFGDELKEKIVERGKNGTLGIRPDSGDPAEVVLEVLNKLGKKFGTSVNSKGYKMLPPYVCVIQGDKVSYESVSTILETLKKENWSTDLLCFGSGGGLLQDINRDTQKCAFKCSYAVIDGKEVNVFKDPITDRGKKSKKGRLTLEKVNGQFVTMEEGLGDPTKDIMQVVFENGKLLKDFTLKEVRDNAEIDLVKTEAAK